MSLANLPRDGEPIAQAKTGPLGETLFVPTRLFLRFLEDLADVSSTEQDATPELNVAITRLKAVQRDAQAIFDNGHNEIFQLRAQVKSQRIEINELKDRIKNLEQLQ